MDTIESIKNYIQFLITECGLSVTLHPKEKEALITLSELMVYNIHRNSYCTCVKATEKGQAMCVAQQEKVLSRCREYKDSFCGVCHGGVFEYIYPISTGDAILGFISVSGYQTQNEEAYLQKTAERFSIAAEQLKNAYETLNASIPPKSRIDTLITPLCQMLELAYRTNAAPAPDADRLIDRILRYIRQNYAMNITSESLCQEFSCSRSYLSHSFKAVVGQSLREYLIDLRLSHAKHLLRFSNLTVTEIAFSVGFNDSNYFSSVFKKNVGTSPLAYRKDGRITKYP